MADANFVKFVFGTSAAYAALGTKDANTLYFITDSRQIYKGGTLFTGGRFLTVTSYPVAGDVNTIYVNTSDGSAKFWDGTKYQIVVKPSPGAIADTPDNDTLATQKAVADYVATKLTALDATSLGKRVTANEAAIGKLNGTGDGSVTKTVNDAVGAAKNELRGNIDRKANKATTLAGYGISDAYTKEEANTKISSAVANAHHLKRSIVDTLPATGDADTIYMKPKAGSGDDIYDEFMWINNRYERIGNSAVNLTDYYTKGQVDSKVNDAKSTAATDAQSKANKALSDAKAYADGLAGNYATKAQGAKADSALQAADIVESKKNGNISVKGVDVAVYGLGSAAYTESSVYDAAGTANAAKTEAIRAASADATSKSNAAKNEAISTASMDATTKANKALSDAKTYTDSKLAWGTL